MDTVRYMKAVGPRNNLTKAQLKQFTRYYNEMMRRADPMTQGKSWHTEGAAGVNWDRVLGMAIVVASGIAVMVVCAALWPW
jgi:hypothetical protein